MYCEVSVMTESDENRIRILDNPCDFWLEYGLYIDDQLTFRIQIKYVPSLLTKYETRELTT
jgi:hypothetical protein